MYVSSSDSAKPALSFRNTPSSPSGFTRHSSTSLAKRGSECKFPLFVGFICLLKCFVTRGIKTYHAEDGSGVGAAIIAAMTKKRKAQGLFEHV
jgi:hypothetical protein